MFQRLKRRLIGRPLKNEAIHGEKYNILWGLPILASDAISSVAYAGEAMLVVLIPAIYGMAFNQLTFLSLAIIGLLVLPYLVFAASSSPLDRLKNTGSGASGPYAAANETTVSAIIGVVINVAISLLGIIFVVLIVLAGFKWMMAGGNEDDVSKAKARISTAIIGLVLTLSAYAIWALVSNYLL